MDGSQMLGVPTVGCRAATHQEFSLDIARPIEPLTLVASLSVDAPTASFAARHRPHPHPPRAWPPIPLPGARDERGHRPPRWPRT
jgi:hypothetical protein